MARVYVIDDDSAARDSLRMLLSAVGHNVEAFRDGESFLEGADLSADGCAVIDLGLPGIDGLGVQQAMRRAGARLRIIMISGKADVGRAVQAMRDGAVDFVEKPYQPVHLLEAVERALDAPAPAAAPGAGDGELQDAPAPVLAAFAGRMDRLTPREREVFDRLLLGLQNKEIARELDISPRTVEIHRGRVMEKLECRNLAELVRLGIGGGVA